jgi:hypothetical protein
MSAMCEAGVDADEMPNGTGEYGLVTTNPIPCRTIMGSTAYLGRLRAADGAKVKYERLGSIQSYVSAQPIDFYKITHPSGHTIATLYISPYQKRISGRAPRGFMLAENSFAQIAPVQDGGTVQGDAGERMDGPTPRFDAERHRDKSIRSLFESIFPIVADSHNAVIELHDLKFRAETESGALLMLTLRLITFKLDEETATRGVADIFEQDVFLGRIPLPHRPSAISPDYHDAILNMELIVRQRLSSMNLEGLAPWDLLVNIPLGSHVWDVVGG